MNKRFVFLFIIIFSFTLISATSLWNSEKNGENNNSSIFVKNVTFEVGDAIQLLVMENPSLSVQDDMADYRTPATESLGSLFRTIGGVELQNFLPLGATDPNALGVNNRQSQSQSQASVQLFITVEILEEKNNTFKVRGEKEIKVGVERKTMIVQGYIPKNSIDSSGMAESADMLNAQIWYDGDVVFQQDPDEPSWASWILSGISNMFF